MDQLEQNELKNSLESLLSTLQCPVCLCLLDRQSVLCVNGHAVCKKCMDKLMSTTKQNACPKCRNGLSNLQQNTVFSQILEILPHCCRFDRCSYLVKPGDDHETFCRFRPTECKFPNCSWFGSVENIPFHIEDKHPLEKIYSGTKHTLSTPQSYVDGKGVLLFSACGHYFWQRMKPYSSRETPSSNCLDDEYRFSFHPVFVGKPTCDVYIRIWFRSEDKEFFSSMKFKMDQNNATGNSFYFPRSMIFSFITDNELKYDLMITEVRNDAVKSLIE
ncbi:E3 ubiquitin-protein ligase Siah2-like [Macrosteles quadrilineatus]|uniref:E3 ubiquitin-protein ligase Siah2-like n=1 Tax=Macrosteles quadrilineatus TaxID=74068 RepID=UPI0023E1B555|nr:E3 ubiquitin-protein ligase Siah2-like [Macrosteles quadrilineatus]